jgi:two-component system response regulator FixJ
MSRTVCVIDGDAGVRNSLGSLLGTLPVQVRTYSSAEEFLEDREGEEPDLIITELVLPGMRGLDLLDRLASEGRFVPTLGLAEGLGPHELREAEESGMLGILEKPFVYWAVIQVVQETMGMAG